MTELANVMYENAGIRILGTKLEPWFVAVDVLRALGVHKNYIKRTLDGLDEDEKSVVKLATEADDMVVATDYHPDCSVIKLMTEQDKIKGDHNTVWVISEPGLYKIIFRSRTEKAKAFTRWVTHEVLPQIRRTGRYEPPKPKRGRGRPALLTVGPTYKIATGEELLISDLRVRCAILEDVRIDKSKFKKATAEKCVEYINGELAAGRVIRFPYVDDGQKDEFYYIEVDGKRVEIPK